MEEFDWHDTLNRKYSQLWSERRCSSLIVNPQSTQFTISKAQSARSSWRQWKPSSILLETTWQSLELSCLMKRIPQDLALPFPFAFLAFWSAFLLSARSFLPASLWKLFFSWLERSAGSSQTIKGSANHYLDLDEKETSFVFSPNSDFSNTEESWPYGNSWTPKMSLYSNHQCSWSFWCPRVESSHIHFSRSMSWSILLHECIQYQLNSGQNQESTSSHA